MRLKLSRFRRNFNKDLPIEFTEQNLSSFGGLELFSRYLRRVELSRRVGKACRGKGIRSDYGSVRLVLVLVGMLLVGARRLEHLQYVCDDPMLLRFCGLRRLPSRPTIVNWLKQFTGERLKGLSELNGVLVHIFEQVERLGLNRLTVDMDGTVVQAGNQVGWAFRGFNPHRKKNKSFYPLFAHLAQTGQILKSRNRPGNVHDSKGADAFLRELIGELRGQFGRSRKLEFRTDAAFFNEKILKRLERSRSEFAIKAPFWPWLGLKEVVAGRKRWHRVSDEIDGFSIKHFIEPWNITVRIAIYRKRVRHRTAKNFQLDLFSPEGDLTVYENVELPLTYRGMPSAERKTRVNDALEKVRHGASHEAFPVPALRWSAAARRRRPSCGRRTIEVIQGLNEGDQVIYAFEMDECSVFSHGI